MDPNSNDWLWRVAWDGRQLHIKTGVTVDDIDAMVERALAFKKQILQSTNPIVEVSDAPRKVLFTPTPEELKHLT